MSKDRRILHMAAVLARRYYADYEAYVAECAMHRGHGHRPRYCEHGADQWTDYDNICGGCEDGVTMRDGVQRRQRALAEARYRVARQDALIAWAAEGAHLGVPSTGVHYNWLRDELRCLSL